MECGLLRRLLVLTSSIVVLQLSRKLEAPSPAHAVKTFLEALGEANFL